MKKLTILLLAASFGLARAEGPDFVKEIAPILKASCVKCHNSTKAKGKLNLETKEGAMKGGKGGKTVVPGKPAESTMIKSIELPADDEDAMPPKDKAPRPNADQLALLKKWIETGANWPDGETVKPDPAPAPAAPEKKP